jgi:rod shape-determining protein MreC
MENFFARYKNPLVLMAVLFIQVVALATQVKRTENARTGNTASGTRLIRVWTVTAFTPVQKLFVSTGHFFRDGWHNYADLRGVRKQNRDLQDEVAHLQMEQVRLRQDADQARRLQALLEFKQKYVSRTVAAQVIGTSGTEQSRVLTIDKGSHDGIRTEMAVITPDGIVGKIKEVFPLSSQVLLINDHDSGAGVILENSRLQGIVKGTSLGELQVTDVMSDEKVEPGDHVITSGGDRIYPKGFSVGTVISASPDRDNDPFLAIRIKPAADLSRLEEVLVVTKIADEIPSVAGGPLPMRAADILAQRLPSIPKQEANSTKSPGGSPGGLAPNGAAAATPSPSSARTSQIPVVGTEQKPGSATGQAKQASGASSVPESVPSASTKPGTEQKRPGGSGQPKAAPIGPSGTAPASARPKAAATKTKVQAAPAYSAAPGDSQPKEPDQPGTTPPAATTTTTPEKPPR